MWCLKGLYGSFRSDLVRVPKGVCGQVGLVLGGCIGRAWIL